MNKKEIHTKIIDYYISNDIIFKTILYNNKIIKNVIDQMVDDYIKIPTLDNGRGESNILGECNRVSTIIMNELLIINNPRIIGVSELNGIVYDEHKIDDGYMIDNEEMYSSHTALNLYLWDEKYTEIIVYHIDLTNSQFNLKTFTNEYFVNNINEIHNKLFILGKDSPIVYLLDDNEYVRDELKFQGYEPSHYFNEGFFIKLLKKEKDIPNDIFPSILLTEPIINTWILKNYSIDNIIILENSKLLIVNIPDDKLDDIYNGEIVNDINYKIIDEFNYNF